MARATSRVRGTHNVFGHDFMHWCQCRNLCARPVFRLMRQHHESESDTKCLDLGNKHRLTVKPTML
jgi:hypothetical protein